MICKLDKKEPEEPFGPYAATRFLKKTYNLKNFPTNVWIGQGKKQHSAGQKLTECSLKICPSQDKKQHIRMKQRTTHYSLIERSMGSGEGYPITEKGFLVHFFYCNSWV